MRVDRSFGFVDLCGFTGFTDARGDDAAVQVLTQFRSIVRETASDRGVRVAKWLGDGAMFVSPQAAPLLEMAVDLTRRAEALDLELLVRAGMSSGAVILFEGDDYIGGPVNLAARLCDLAAPRELLASAELAAAVPATVDYAAVGPVTVAGFAQPVDVIRLEAARVGPRS
jgi:class 3 adenylate cyclase